MAKKHLMAKCIAQIQICFYLATKLYAKLFTQCGIIEPYKEFVFRYINDKITCVINKSKIHPRNTGERQAV